MFVEGSAAPASYINIEDAHRYIIIYDTIFMKINSNPFISIVY